MKKKNLVKIIVNNILIIAFLLTYFMDLTGLELHQYLGIAAGVFLIVHIISHAQWIKQVSTRFFLKLSKRVRFYYFLDAFLLITISSITFTGILISTWLEIDYAVYPLIRSVHLLSSIGGLLLLIVKLAFHWKWFAGLFSRVRLPRINSSAPSSAPTIVTAQNKKAYTRRDALKTIGAISAAGIFGLYKAAAAMTIPEPAAALPAPEVKTAMLPVEPVPQSEVEVQKIEEGKGQGRRRSRGVSSDADHTDQVPIANTVEITPEIQQNELQPTPIPPSQDCVIRCPGACSFPGACRRYIDENGNQLCDLGECLIV